MILTTRDAADLLRVTPSGVRKMVERGELRPLVPGARPLRFGLPDVADVQVRRMSPAEHDTLDSLAARLLAFESGLCHDQSSEACPETGAPLLLPRDPRESR